MVFQGVCWTIIADGMSSAEVEIAKVTLMIRVITLEYNDHTVLNMLMNIMSSKSISRGMKNIEFNRIR